MSPEELPPVRISWSSLKRWEHCPQHQLRVKKREVEKSKMGRVFLPGTVLDLVQRRWLDSANPQPGQMHDLVDEIFETTVEKGEAIIRWKGNPVEDGKRVREDVHTAIDTLEPWLLENVLPYDYCPEVKFNAHLMLPHICGDGVKAPVVLQGGIDVVVRDHDGMFRLYDLKMTRDPSYMNKTLAQLTFYDIAWGIIQGNFQHANAWGFITPMMEENFVPIVVESEHRRQMMQRVYSYAQGTWRDQWEPKSDDDGCGWCEARGVCVKFKETPVIDSNNKVRLSFSKAAEQRRQYRAENRT